MSAMIFTRSWNCSEYWWWTSALLIGLVSEGVDRLHFLPKAAQSFIFCGIRSQNNSMRNHLSSPTIHNLVLFIPVADTRCALMDFCGGKVTKWSGDESLVKLMSENQVSCSEVLSLICHHSLTKSIFSALVKMSFFLFLPLHCHAHQTGSDFRDSLREGRG